MTEKSPFKRMQNVLKEKIKLSFRDLSLIYRSFLRMATTFLIIKLIKEGKDFETYFIVFSIVYLSISWVYIERRAARAAEAKYLIDKFDDAISRIQNFTSSEAFEKSTRDARNAEISEIVDQMIDKRPRGRPKGAGGWANQDAEIVEKMRKLILSTPSMTVHAAATEYANEAAGNATFERKQRRLADRYRATFPDN